MRYVFSQRLRGGRFHITLHLNWMSIALLAGIAIEIVIWTAVAWRAV